MEVIIGLMALAAGITSFVCWIIILIEFFKIRGWIAIFGLCGIVTFIWGWVEVNVHEKRGVMTLWSIVIAISILLNIALVALEPPAGTY